MRFSQVALCSTVALMQSSAAYAWTMAPRALTTTRTMHSTCLSASIAPEEAVDLSAAAFTQQDEGTSIAHGPVVSYFPGGLAAVKLEDDFGVFPLPTVPAAALSTPPVMAGKQKQQNGDDLVGRLAKLPNGSLGVVIAQRPPMAFVFTEHGDVPLEGTVDIMNTMAQINVGGSNDQRIVNGFGQDASTTTESTTTSPNEEDDTVYSHAIFAPIPKVADISLINSPLLTGTTMVDVLAPIGKGQNMLLVGSNVEELRSLACNMFQTQSKTNTKCIYAATSDAQTVLSTLNAAGVLEDESVTVVAARDTIKGDVAQAAEATLVAATACAMAESYAQEEGKDCVVVIDTLDHHKTLWDATTRVLVDIFGMEAVVTADREGGASSEMRAFYSSLIQRAANYKDSAGGSVTLVLLQTIPAAQETETVFEMSDFELYGDKIKARLQMLADKKIPLTAATLRKIQVPIPSDYEGKRRLVLQHVDDLISMSDGQVWFNDNDNDNTEKQHSPPVNAQRSITRVGIGADTQSRADAPAIRRIAEGVRLDLAQSASMEGAEQTTASASQSRRERGWLLALHQDKGQHNARVLSESCIALLAASMGVLDNDDDDMEKKNVVEELIQHVQSRVPSNVLQDIDETFDMTAEVQTELEEAIRSYFV